MLLLLALMLSQLDLTPQLSDTGSKFDPLARPGLPCFCGFQQFRDRN